MGEIADDMLSGFQCSLCGLFFSGEHGYPVVCNDCWHDMSKYERRHYAQATLPEIREGE